MHTQVHVQARGGGPRPGLTWQLLAKRTQTLGTDGEAEVEGGGAGGGGWWIRYKIAGARRCQTANDSVGVGERDGEEHKGGWREQKAKGGEAASSEETQTQRGSEAATGAGAQGPSGGRLWFTT